MFKYGSRCFGSIKEACLFYRMPEREIIKYLASNNDMDQLIEDLDLEDLIQVNTFRQRNLSDTIQEIQSIYQEYMMMENSEEPTLLDALERDLREASESVLSIASHDELLEVFGQPQELDFEIDFSDSIAHYTESGGHWGFLTLADTDEEIEDDEALIFSDPYPFQVEMELLAKTDDQDRIGDVPGDEDGSGWVINDPWLMEDPTCPKTLLDDKVVVVTEGGDHDSKRDAGNWLEFNK